jgi:ribosomal-protein-alanine N-acetyltransferase
MILVPATGEQADAMARTHAQSFETGWSAADIAACLAAPGGYGVVAATDDEPSDVGGFLLARTIAGEAEILTLAVSPQNRRRGVARALLEAATGVASALGVATMFLEVASDNAAALALYEQAGFHQAGLRKRYYLRPGRPAGDALVLRCDLTGRP